MADHIIAILTNKATNTTTVITKCPICGKLSNVNVASDAFERWKGGELTQFAFPNVDITTREMLIGGMCKECQDKFFDTFDDEEEEEEEEVKA